MLTPCEDLLSGVVERLVLPRAGEPAALLIQKNRTEAAVVLRDAMRVFVLMTGATPADELMPRMRALLQAERPEVVDGIALSSIYAVVLGEAALDAAAWKLPGSSGGLIGISPAGVQLLAKCPEASDDSYEPVLEPLRRALAALAEPGAPATADELARAERAGESALVVEARYHARSMFPIATALVGAFTVLVFAAQLWWGATSGSMLLVRMGANHGRFVAAGEWDRLIVGGYLHANLVHLASNMVWLAIMGPLLEAAIGARRFLVLYTVLLLGSEGIVAWLQPEQIGVGSSGAIMGLMGAVGALGWRSPELVPPISGYANSVAALFYLGLQWLFSFGPQVSFLAHFAGGVVGALAVATGLPQAGVPALEEPREQESPSSVLVALGAMCGALLLTLFAFQRSLARGRPWDTRPPELARGVLAKAKLAGLWPVGSTLAPAKEGEDFTRYVLGAPGGDALEISLIDRTCRFADDDGATALQHLRESLTSADDKRDFLASAKIAPVGTRTGARAEHARGGERRIRWIFCVGGKEVDVQIWMVPPADASYERRAMECLASLERLP